MHIVTISKDKIRISLTDQEIIELFGSYDMIDYSNPHSKMAINMLFHIAVPDDMLPLDCKRVLIEVKPENTGCSIYFTRIYSGKRFRKVVDIREYLLEFENSNDLIDCICNISPTSVITSRLYTNKGTYQLIISAQKSFGLTLLQVSEYCRVSTDKIKISEVEEHHILVCQNDAVPKILKAFKAF